MKLGSGTVLNFKIDGIHKKCTVSAINGKLVKIFEEGGTYKQMPLDTLMELIDRNIVTIEDNIQQSKYDIE